MTIKPVKNDKNEGDVSPQHRDCLNKIASPKNPSTQHGIDQRSNLRGPGYVDEVHGNRHRRTNPKSASSHSSTSGSNAQKSHKQRLGGHSSSHGTSASEASIAAANEAESVGSKPSTSVATNSLESSTSNVIPGFIASNSNTSNSNNLSNSSGNNNNNNNSSNPSGMNLSLKNAPDRGLNCDTNDDDDRHSYSGYNSDDEHHGQKYDLTHEEWEERDRLFVKTMSDRGFVIEAIMEDGACLFRAISLQIYGDQEMHEMIRQQTMDYIHKNREYFMQFVTEDINEYVSRKRNNHVHGNHIEIQAISEIYNRPVEIYAYHTEPVNIFGQDQIKEGIEPLRLSYQRGSHYNAILNPYRPAVGVGLGLAGYCIKEEAPNVKHLRDAVRLSEDLEIEQTMFEDKLKTTDWEATNDAIAEQIARESYLQWCREKQQQKTSQNVHNSTITSTATASASVAAPYNFTKMHSKSPRDSDDGSCESVDYYSNSLSPNTDSSSPDDRQQGESSERRNRKRRSHRRKLAQQQPACNASFSSLNESTSPQPASCPYAIEPAGNVPAPDSPSKKRKLSTHADLPGPSYTKSTQPIPKDTPMSEFYHSLLESTYEDDMNSTSQLSEEDMIEKALQMSRLEFMHSKAM